MDKPTHTDGPSHRIRTTMLSKTRVLKTLRDQREILVNARGSAINQGGVLELDRAILSIQEME
jgi:hypothetical protein